MRIVANIAYEQGRLIGRGQNSVGVYLCKDDQLGCELAVKVIEKARIHDLTNAWAEAKAMHEARHANVVAPQYGCDTADHIMLAMPYFQRGPLGDRIARSPLRLLEIIRIGQGILSGVSHLHAKGYTHNDLKPSNVLYSDSDVPMVSDFGQVQQLGPTGTAPAPPLIYDAAISPEMILTHNATPASDVYQVGLTLYRAANGDPWFNDQYHAAGADLGQMTVDGTFPDRDSYLPHIPLIMRKCINKALNIDVTKRYATALEFATALGRVRATHDWQTICHTNNEIEWRSQQSGGPDLVVRRVAVGTRWDVTIHHERPGQSRRTKTILWGYKLADRAAFTHLRQVFAALE